MELPNVTLDWLRLWWESHPDRTATVAHACHCIISEAVADEVGLPVSYCPGESLYVWPEGTYIFNMAPLSGNYLAEITISDKVCELAMAFDSVEQQGRIPAKEIVALIDERSGKG